MNDSGDGIPGKNQLIEIFFKKYTPLLLSTVAKFYKSNRGDMIQGFLEEKICKLSAKQLQDLLEEKGPKYIKAMMKNYLTDQKRKDIRRKKKDKELTQFLSGRESTYTPTYADANVKETIRKWEKEIRRAFPYSKHHLKIFHMMVDGLDNKEIAQLTGLSRDNIRTIRCRIRAVLKKQLAVTL